MEGSRGGPGGSRRGLGGLLERLGLQGPSQNALGGLWERSGVEKNLHGTALGRPKRNFKRGFSHLGLQKASQKEAKSVPNRVRKATRAQNGETLIFADSTQDFNDF